MTSGERRSSGRVKLGFALVFTAGIALSGCGGAQRLAAPPPEDPGASELSYGPGPNGGPGYRRALQLGLRDSYPLEVGNRWDYVIASTTRIVSPGSPDGIALTEHPWVVEITGTEVFGGRRYHMQVEYDPRALGAPLPRPYPFALRQDAGGLYNRDLVYVSGPARASDAVAGSREAAALRAHVANALAGHPHRAAFERAAEALATRLPSLRTAAFGGRLGPGEGADPDEITLLGYPLHPFARWIVRDSPRFSRIVEARESLELPAGRFSAWRIRGDSELYGPADVVYFWYAREGLVRMLVHSESDAVDQQGQVVGRLIWDQDQRLTAYSLERPVGPTGTTATVARSEDDR